MIRLEIQQLLLQFTSSLILAPTIAVILSIFYIYRRIIDIILRLQLKHRYGGLLDGSDSIWAIEDDSALSVINVLAILEKDARHSNVNFLESFRNLINTRLIDSPFQKLLYSRKKKYGYYFWEKSNEIDLDKRVKWLEYERTSCDGSCDNIYNGHLKRIIRNVCNQPLPDNHTATWEILIGKSCPRSSYYYLRRMEERLKHGKIRIPILFRVHHSLADGVGLLRLLLDAIADKNSSRNDSKMGNSLEDYETITVIVPQRIGQKYVYTFDKMGVNMSPSYEEALASARMPFAYSLKLSHIQKLIQTVLEVGLKYVQNFTMEEAQKELFVLFHKKWMEMKDFLLDDLYHRLRALLSVISILLTAPACLIRQTLRSMDHSTLHGPELTGEKLISYWMEDDFRNSDEEKLLTKVQNIKYLTGARFEDVFLAALSASLHKYYLRTGATAPDSISIVLPSRVDDSVNIDSLNNNFTVGLMRLCIGEINGTTTDNPREDWRTLERLQDVKTEKTQLFNRSDRIVNYLVIKYLSAALPEMILKPLLKSHSTLVFSNLIGPERVNILGHSLKNIVFWIPNRSYTGIGCSLLSYRGYLHLSMIADKALIKDEKLLTEILENTVREIDILYDRLVLSYPRRKHYNVSTPIKKDFGVSRD